MPLDDDIRRELDSLPRWQPPGEGDQDSGQDGDPGDPPEWLDDVPPPEPEDVPPEPPRRGGWTPRLVVDRGPHAAAARAAPSSNGGGDDEEETRAEWPAALDLAALADQEPGAPRFVIQDWIPEGYATMLAGHGGAGKSYIALYQAVCIASGRSWLGLETGQRRVTYLSCEDRENVIHWRLKRICDYLGIDMASLAGWLDVIDLVGCETILWQAAGVDQPNTTAAYRTLADRIRPTDVLYVDGVSDTYGGNENDRAQVKAYVNSLLALIGAEQGAVVLIAHVNKESAKTSSSAEGYAGSTQWHNAVRARAYLRHEVQDGEDGGQPTKTGNLLLDLQKSNLGKADQTIKLAWDETAKLFSPIGGGPGGGGEHWIDRQQHENKADETFLRLLQSLEGQGRRASHKPNAPNHAPKLFARQPNNGGMGKRDFSAAMDRLFEAGRIKVSTYTGGNRATYECLVETRNE